MRTLSKSDKRVRKMVVKARRTFTTFFSDADFYELIINDEDNAGELFARNLPRSVGQLCRKGETVEVEITFKVKKLIED